MVLGWILVRRRAWLKSLPHDAPVSTPSSTQGSVRVAPVPVREGLLHGDRTSVSALNSSGPSRPSRYLPLPLGTDGKEPPDTQTPGTGTRRVQKPRVYWEGPGSVSPVVDPLAGPVERRKERSRRCPSDRMTGGKGRSCTVDVYDRSSYPSGRDFPSPRTSGVKDSQESEAPTGRNVRGFHTGPPVRREDGDVGIEGRSDEDYRPPGRRGGQGRREWTSLNSHRLYMTFWCRVGNCRSCGFWVLHGSYPSSCR